MKKSELEEIETISIHYTFYIVLHSNRDSSEAHCQPDFVHRASAQVTVSPQQNLLPGLPFILPAQSPGQVIQFSPLLGWQIPSPLQVETFASVVVTTSNPMVALVVVTKSGPTIASGCSPIDAV
jgi:hypothetical protein